MSGNLRNGGRWFVVAALVILVLTAAAGLVIIGVGGYCRSEYGKHGYIWDDVKMAFGLYFAGVAFPIWVRAVFYWKRKTNEHSDRPTIRRGIVC